MCTVGVAEMDGTRCTVGERHLVCKAGWMEAQCDADLSEIV